MKSNIPDHRPVVWTMMGTVCPLSPMEQWAPKMEFMSDLVETKDPRSKSSFCPIQMIKRCIALLVEKQLLYLCSFTTFWVMEFLLLLLGQWLNFKLFVIDIFSLSCYFRVHWPSESFFWSVSTTKSDDFDSSKDQLHLRGSLAEHGGHYQSSGHRQRGAILGVVGYELRENYQGGTGI